MFAGDVHGILEKPLTLEPVMQDATVCWVLVEINEPCVFLWKENIFF